MPAVLQAHELRRFGKKGGGRISHSTPGSLVMTIRFGVYFDESNRQYGNSVLREDREEGVLIRKWLNENISGHFHVSSASYVFFEKEEDAMLCYLAFAGS